MENKDLNLGLVYLNFKTSPLSDISYIMSKIMEIKKKILSKVKEYFIWQFDKSQKRFRLNVISANFSVIL